MLKAYVDRESTDSANSQSSIYVASMLVTPFNLCDHGLNNKHSSVFGMALWNSEILADLDSYLSHLCLSQADIHKRIKATQLCLMTFPLKPLC